MPELVTFGEIMGRLTAPGYKRFPQAMPGSLDVSFAGAEANVAVSYAWFGGKAAFVSALPDHAVGDAVVQSLRKYTVDTSGIVRTAEGRLGLYFVETGANQRPGRVIYDRAHSSFATLPAEAYNFDKALQSAGAFHFTGITPALSATAAEACRAAVDTARKKGLSISCDLNFRKKLWRWDADKEPAALAGETMRGLMPFVDILIANESDIEDVLGIRAGKTDTEKGSLDISAYPDVAGKVAEAFPNLKRIAITLRESVSASHNNWGAMLMDTETGNAFFAPVVNGHYAPYEIRAIVDRVGAGDSFAGALLYALHEAFPEDPEAAVGFAAAASCLAHSIEGDFNLNTFEEVELLRRGNASGRVQR